MQIRNHRWFLVIVIMLWSASVFSYAPDPYPSYPDTTTEEPTKETGDEKPTTANNPSKKEPESESKPGSEKETNKPKNK